MAERKIKRALISVYDKTGIVEFARALVQEFGIEIISTGGTASLLKENGIPVTLVEQITGFPEMLDGRVKTLHPNIHAAILADRDNPKHMQELRKRRLEPIDMVVVNLYPFEKTVADPNCTFEQAIEMIDIGGPCLLRAAAKNHKHVWPIMSSRGFGAALAHLRGDDLMPEMELRRAIAGGVFALTSSYDAAVADFLNTFGSDEWRNRPPMLGANIWLNLERRSSLRYGENPHQIGAFYRLPNTPHGLRLKGGSTKKEVGSYNNVLDADAAFQLCRDLSQHQDRWVQQSHQTAFVCVFIKHSNACGVGVAESPSEAYRRAYMGDPNAAMGGVLCCNTPVTAEFADVVMNTYQRWGKEAGAGGFFLDAWVAPEFPADARDVITSAKDWGNRVRFFEMIDRPSFDPLPEGELQFRHVLGGMLAQQWDNLGLNEDEWKIATKRKPSESEISGLRLAWLVAKHTKSNAISICKDGMLIGNGAGQMSRVMSCRLATWLANENGHADKLKGSVAASDAFFPFADGPTILMDAGVTAIIQPGGSKRDEEVIAACDARDVAMVFTGTRHFRH
jgi:phosphoribosylaminoimidazolecarboxamide formyltransferase/IMP cyclohydrolase